MIEDRPTVEVELQDASTETVTRLGDGQTVEIELKDVSTVRVYLQEWV